MYAHLSYHNKHVGLFRVFSGETGSETHCSICQVLISVITAGGQFTIVI